MHSSPPKASASAASVESPSGLATAVSGAENSDANPEGRGEAATDEEGSGASAPPDPPSRSLSGPSDRAPASAGDEEGPSWAAAVVEAASASVEGENDNSTRESVQMAPSGMSGVSKSDDAKTTPTPHFVVPPSPIELVRSDSLVRVPPRDNLERPMGEELPPMGDDSATMTGEEAPSGPEEVGIAKEQLEAEDELAAVAATSGTPPPLSEEADNDESVTTAPSQSPEGVHQKQPSGTHISEELAEEDVDVTPQPREEDAEADSKPLMIESATTSPRSSVTSPMTVHLPQQQQMEQSPPPTNPSPLNLHSHAAAAQQQQRNQSPPLPPASTPSKITYATPPPAHPGRRSIALRLLEELPPASPVKSPLISSVKGLTDTPFKSLRKFRSLSLSSSAFASGGLAAAVAAPSPDKDGGRESTVDRGTITVSWYEGTTSGEMQDHVFNCVLRKLQSIPEVQMKAKGGGRVKLEDVRLLDENVTPHGEVVLCPFLPDGSRFLLRFKLAIKRPKPSPAPANSFLNPYSAPSYISRPPDSPSAEPSPHPSNPNLASLDKVDMVLNQNARASHQRQHLAQQNQQTQQMLGVVAALLQQQQSGQQLNVNAAAATAGAALPGLPFIPDMGTSETPREEKKEESTNGQPSNGAAPNTPRTMNRAATGTPAMEPIAENPTDQRIEQQLRQLNELFLQRRSSSVVSTTNEQSGAKGGDQTLPGDDDEKPAAFYREEKKQVIFIIANYFVLFMAFIALSAEIQNRLPGWMNWVQDNYDSVQNCATDRDALIECLSNGDFSGLVASFLLWITQSASAKRVFLFGFDTPKKLWTVVYEALVTAVCWGTSYLFIRRGLNPNTRHHFLHKYWKDAVYGSLAGFNAAFMKAVLKNLIPQDVALEALEGRQLRIFHWMGQMVGSVAEE